MMKADQTVMTGYSGEFTFHLDKPGYYAVAAKREGFNAPGGNSSGMTEVLAYGTAVLIEKV